MWQCLIFIKVKPASLLLLTAGGTRVCRWIPVEIHLAYRGNSGETLLTVVKAAKQSNKLRLSRMPCAMTANIICCRWWRAKEHLQDGLFSSGIEVYLWPLRTGCWIDVDSIGTNNRSLLYENFSGVCGLQGTLYPILVGHGQDVRRVVMDGICNISTIAKLLTLKQL